MKKFVLSKAALMATMGAHFAAFQAAKASAAVLYERRDEPTLASISEAITKINEAFVDYKKTNDARLEAVQKGLPTGDFDAKLARLDAVIDDLKDQKSKLEKLEVKMSRPGAFAGRKPMDGETEEAAEYRTAFIDWIRSPLSEEAKAKVTAAGRAVEAKANAAASSDIERRAAQVVTSTGAAGGFALPEQIEREIARLSVDISPVRSVATVRQVGTSDYKELFDANGAAFEWVGETDTRNQTNTPDLREVAPTFGMASAKPQASEESMDDLFFDVAAWLQLSVAEAIAQGEGAAFVSGNGVKKPTGFLAGPTPVVTGDASRAFGTLQYIASGQASALPTSLDTFYDVVYSLRARYRRNAVWMSNKVTLASVRKYKDTTGQYLWAPAVAAGQPDVFMGYPVVEAEDMPVVAANAFPIAFGDFREGYLIADRVGMRMTRDEVTTPGFVKFYVRKRVGGILRNTQAIKLLKIAAS